MEKPEGRSRLSTAKRVIESGRRRGAVCSRDERRQVVLGSALRAGVAETTEALVMGSFNFMRLFYRKGLES